MNTGNTYRWARDIFAATIIGAAAFSLGGRWAFDALVAYGFDIFSPTLSQDLAMLLAWMISFPSITFSDAVPMSRIWLAVNGAVWGILLHVLSIFGSYGKRRVRRKATTPA
jgi:hypothetical protein